MHGLCGGTGREAKAQVLCVGDGFLEQRTHVIVVERVDDVATVALADNEAEMA